MGARDWHPRNVLAVAVGIAVAAVVVPFMVLVQIPMYLLGIGQTADRSPEEVAGYLRRFMAGTEGDRDLDDFESVPITDKELEEVRREFLSLRWWDDASRARARELLSKVEVMARQNG
jgi:hypothetical protein